MVNDWKHDLRRFFDKLNDLYKDGAELYHGMVLLQNGACATIADLTPGFYVSLGRELVDRVAIKTPTGEVLLHYFYGPDSDKPDESGLKAFKRRLAATETLVTRIPAACVPQAVWASTGDRQTDNILWWLRSAYFLAWKYPKQPPNAEVEVCFLAEKFTDRQAFASWDTCPTVPGFSVGATTARYRAYTGSSRRRTLKKEVLRCPSC